MSAEKHAVVTGEKDTSRPTSLEHSKDGHVVHSSEPGVEELNNMSEEDLRRMERKLVRRIDIRMMPALILVYIMNYLDRNNAGAARLRGFQSDLSADDTQFATILSILYVGYILMQIPSNLLLERIGRPSLYLPFCMLLWGLMSVLTGEVTSFGGAVAVRFFLGFVEAAFFPGALFLLSRWYTKKELALRTALLYTGSIASNAINGLIAAGILGNMQGVLGHAAWRWLFYIEGAITMGIAIGCVFVLPDFPSTTKWLSHAERALAQRRMARDAGVADDNAGMTNGQAVLAVVKDPKAWLLCWALTASVLGLSFNAYFPTLTATLGYSPIISLLLVAPPWAFSALCCWANAWHADRTGEKTFHIVVPFGIAILGLVILEATQATAARFVGLFLLAQGYAGFVVLLSWISSTIARPPAKRAVAIAGINAFSQLTNIAGSYIYPTRWGPTYRYSFAINLSSFGLAIALVLALRFYLASLNKKLDEAQATNEAHDAALDKAAQLEGVSAADAAAARRSWRYLI